MRPEDASPVTQLVLAIVEPADAYRLIRLLNARGHRATRLDSQGGFLREGNAIVLVGTDERGAEEVCELITSSCKVRIEMAAGVPHADPVSLSSVPMPVEVGGVVVFSLPVERTYRLSTRAAAHAAVASGSGR